MRTGEPLIHKNMITIQPFLKNWCQLDTPTHRPTPLPPLHAWVITPNSRAASLGSFPSPWRQLGSHPWTSHMSVLPADSLVLVYSLHSPHHSTGSTWCTWNKYVFWDPNNSIQSRLCGCTVSCIHAPLLQLCWTLCPTDCSPLGSSVRGILQARILE